MPSPSRLFLFSDGAYEVRRPDGSMLDFDEFLEALARPAAPGVSELDRLLDFVREVHGSSGLEDDFSIVKLEL